MKKHIIQFVANTKKNLFVFLALPFLWTSCRNNTEITESISPNAETAPRSALVTADKASGIKLFSFMEVNDTNPLNNLNFTLKKSGKPLVDMVVLFSANINYDAVNDKVIVSNNPNVQHLLTNKAKYLKPLRDKGMKVILGILGNHDRSGVANLSTQRAKQFAQELKKTCELYDLDGVFFDDKYSAYENPPPAGFVTPSNNAAARLAYETKQAMPNKLVTVYVYSRTASFPNPVDGVQAGKFVDYAIHDYGGTWDLSSNYPGLPKSGMAMASQEFNRDYYATAQSLRNLRTSGYGAHMIFAMDPNRSNFTTKQLPAMKLIAKELYDDELVYTNTPYKKDW